MGMRISRLIFSALLTVSLALPFSAYAIGYPIGGKVISAVPVPLCGGVVVTVVGLGGVGSGVFLYAPGVINYLYGPPIPGRWILGLSDVPTHCGLRASLVGTSFGI